MSKYTVIYNPLAGNGSGKATAETIHAAFPEDTFRFEDITKIEDPNAFLAALPADEKPLYTGGDGTLNRLANTVDFDTLDREVYYYPAGTGNDFMNDVREKEGNGIFCINKYMKSLPVVTVNGQTCKVLNGVGFGIDGYCCEVGDKMKETSDKPVNYTAIAIKGLLFYFKPVNAEVTVDGVTHTYKKAWLAPTMNGRFYGGGMNATPNQDRLDPTGTLSTLVMYGSGKLHTLMVFPNIFKGTHVDHKECVEVLTGKNITVRFDAPTALQIDGETISGVTEYTMTSTRA